MPHLKKTQCEINSVRLIEMKNLGNIEYIFLIDTKYNVSQN